MADAGDRRLESGPPPRGRELWLMAVVLAVALVAVGWLQSRQNALVEQVVRGSDEAAVLTLVEVESEYLKLVDRWRQAAVAPEFDADPVRRQYETWLNRIEASGQQEVQRLTASNAEAAVTQAELENFRRQADAVVGRLATVVTRESLVQLTPQLDALAEPVHQLTRIGAQQAQLAGDERNRAMRQHSRLGMVLMAFVLALLLGLAALAVRQIRQLRRQREQMLEMTAHLREARIQADAANRAKSEFLAHMSHEIRTPFQGLLGMLALLRETGLNPRQTDFVRTANESADHLLMILNDILDLSQLESGRMALNRAPADARALLREVEALMRPLAAAKVLALHVDAEPAVPDRVLIDVTRVKQILFNLLSNAIKFSVRGSVSLDLRLPPGATPRLQFVVTDTGIGMDRATVARIFEHETPARRTNGDQVPEAALLRSSGTGLGLDISRKLARLMGGDISVDSVPGEGSVFRFELPLLPLPPGVAATETDAPLATAPSRELSVLVAEDHPVNRQYMSALLETMHHRAHFVGDGEAAVRAVQAQHFDVVLMDLHMPELDGVAAARAIRSLPDPAAATLPIIAFTADAFPETRERCRVAGMNDFLAKPVRPQDLAAALRRLFGRAAAGPAAAPHNDASLPPVQMDAETGLIDMQAIGAALRGVPRARLATLLDDFLDQGPRTVHRFRAAVRDGQPLELRAHAHAAHGAALNLGLTALAATAKALHEGASYLPAHEIARLVHDYEDQVGRTRRAASDAGLL